MGGLSSLPAAMLLSEFRQSGQRLFPLFSKLIHNKKRLCQNELTQPLFIVFFRLVPENLFLSESFYGTVFFQRL